MLDLSLLDKRTIIIKYRIDMFLDKKLEIKAEGEVKNRQVNPAWDKGVFQEKVLKDYFLFWKLSTKNEPCQKDNK